MRSLVTACPLVCAKRRDLAVIWSHVAAKAAPSPRTPVRRGYAFCGPELDRLKSGINITLIMPPSINTPFFSHARSRTGKKPKPIPPVYEPEAVAEAILYAAVHPRRDIVVGGGGKVLTWLQKYMPKVADKLMTWGGGGFKAQQQQQPDDGHDSLFQPLTESGAGHGEFGKHAMRSSLYTRYIEQHPALRLAFFATVAIGTIALLRTASRSSERHPLGLFK